MTASSHAATSHLAVAAIAACRHLLMSRRPTRPAPPCRGKQPLQQILESVEGPVAKIVAVIIIIVTGLTLAFGDTSGGFRRLIQIVFGLSIAFAASSFFLSFFSLRRRGADLMAGRRARSPASHAPVHRALTEPILLGGAPRAVAIANGTLAAAVGLGLRLWLAGLAHLGDRPCRRGLGARSATRSSSTSCAGICAIPGISACEVAPMMNLAEYRNRPPALPTFCRGRLWSRRASCSTRTARFSAPRGSAGPISTARRRPSSSAIAGRLNNALRRLGSGWAIFVEAQRHAGAALSGQHVSRIRPRRWSTPSERAVRGGGRAFRESAISSRSSGCRRPRTPRAPKAGSMKAARKRASIRARSCAASSTAPTACCSCSKASCPNAAWLDDARDADLSAFRRSRPSASASACRRRRCISMRCWPISR